MRQIIYPKRIVKQHNAQNEKQLLTKSELQVDLFYEPELVTFEKGSYIILDFGKEMRGGIRVLTYFAEQPTPVRVRFGESVGECCSELGVEWLNHGDAEPIEIDEISKQKNSTNEHGVRDLYITFPRWSDTPIGDTGFRFVRLDFTGKYTIKSIVCVNEILSKKQIYSYRGDKLTEKIFKVAKRTIDLCAGSGYIWDGIKRDRLIWVGDLAPEVVAMATLYGKSKEVENSLEFSKNHAPLPRWMNNFPSYSLWWIIILQDYLKRTGAKEFVAKQMDYLQGLVKQFCDHISEDGTINYPKHFFEWGTDNNKAQVVEGIRALSIMAAKAAVNLLESFGKDSSCAKEFLKRAEKQEIKAEVKTVAAMKHLAVGYLDEQEKAVLLGGGAEGMSTFLGYYMLTAIAAYDKELANSVMKEYYGAMLKLGSTTFWEHFDMPWAEGTPLNKMPKKGKMDSHGDTGEHCYVGYRKSLCHGWAAGVIGYIYESNM